MLDAPKDSSPPAAVPPRVRRAMVEPSAPPVAARAGAGAGAGAGTACEDGSSADVSRAVRASVDLAGRLMGKTLTAADSRNIERISEDFLGACNGDVDTWAAKHRMDPRVVPVLKAAVEAAQKDGGDDPFSSARLGQITKDIYEALAQPGVTKQTNRGVPRPTKAEKKRLRRNKHRA
jgi:hypothetical protein